MQGTIAAMAAKMPIVILTEYGLLACRRRLNMFVMYVHGLLSNNFCFLQILHGRKEGYNSMQHKTPLYLYPIVANFCTGEYTHLRGKPYCIIMLATNHITWLMGPMPFKQCFIRVGSVT